MGARDAGTDEEHIFANEQATLPSDAVATAVGNAHRSVDDAMPRELGSRRQLAEHCTDVSRVAWYAGQPCNLAVRRDLAAWDHGNDLPDTLLV